MVTKKAKPGSADELSALYPSAQVIQVKVRTGPDSGEFEDADVTVEEMDIRQIAQAAQALKPIAASISPASSFLVLAAEHPDEIFAALGVAIRWPAQNVGMLGGASFAKVAAAVWECNRDFFIRLLGLLAFAPQATGAALPGDGPMRSPTSTDGDGPTLERSH